MDTLQRPEAEVYRYPLNIEVASCGISIQALKSIEKHAEWADVINFHFPWPFADFIDLFIKSNKRKIVTYHSDIIRQRALLAVYRPLMDRFLRGVDSIIATSPEYAKSSQVLSRFQHKVSVVPIGLDERSYPQAGSLNLKSAKEKYGDGFFLFVGMLRYYKGLDYLLEAMVGVDFKLLIAGQGPEESKLKHKALKLGLKNTHFLGHVDDELKASLMILSRAVILPSHVRSEAFGVSLLEAAMYGKPLVSCEIETGTTFINKDSETGIVVPPAQPEKLKQALQCLHDSVELSDQYGQGARKRFEQLFQAKAMGRDYAKIYGCLS